MESYQNDINKLKAAGYTPIAVAQLYCEDAFVFETQEEATKGYNQFEMSVVQNNEDRIVGWWYSREDFLEAVTFYETHFPELKVKIFWL